jgi:hypothetical protein
MSDRHSSGLEVAFGLAEFAAQMVEARFVREHPEASKADVEAAVRAWWSDRPGAPDGDAVGRVRQLSEP